MTFDAPGLHASLRGSIQSLSEQGQSALARASKAEKKLRAIEALTYTNPTAVPTALIRETLKGEE